MNNSPHVVIIGAGTLGMCTAFELVRNNVKVTIIEANSIASGSSGRSVGVVGTQMTNEFDIALRSFSINRFQHFKSMGLNFNHIGYLRLARTEEQIKLFEQSIEIQKKYGFKASLYSQESLKKLIPHLYTDDLAGGIFGSDNGFIDPYEMCNILADFIRSSGGIIKQQCTLLESTRKFNGFILKTTKGNVECDFVVNAGGAWASEVANIFGQDLNVFPERHEAMSIYLDEPLEYTMPMVMDLVNGEGTGLNFRHEKPNELITEIHRSDSLVAEDPDTYNDQFNESSKLALAELLMERLPDLPTPRLGRGWAGLYPITADGYPFIGPVDINNERLITAAGAGGYGIQLSPVIGIVASDWILHGAPKTVADSERLIPTKQRNILVNK